MDKSAKTRQLGRKLLLTAAIGTLPLAGCVPEVPVEGAPGGATVTVSAQEADLYRAARSQQTAASVNSYLISYSNSVLVPSLLSSMPVTTLRQVDRSLAAQIPATTLAALPAAVRSALGVGAAAAPRQAAPVTTTTRTTPTRPAATRSTGGDDDDDDDGGGGESGGGGSSPPDDGYS
ncbi:MAG: hypothetical protein AAGA87_16980 [Pseudomonadota bacterium]